MTTLFKKKKFPQNYFWNKFFSPTYNRGITPPQKKKKLNFKMAIS